MRDGHARDQAKEGTAQLESDEPNNANADTQVEAQIKSYLKRKNPAKQIVNQKLDWSNVGSRIDCWTQGNNNNNSKKNLKQGEQPAGACDPPKMQQSVGNSLEFKEG